MGGDKKPTEVRSKFTPTGNEQGGADVQPGGHPENENKDGGGAREQLEREEQLGSGDASNKDDSALDEQDHEGNVKEGAPGIFSALVGDGKEP